MKKTNTIKSLYKDSFDYIKESKKYILTIIIIFFASAIAGLIIPIPEDIVMKLMEILKEIVAQIEGKTTTEIIAFIFLNNTQATLIGLFAGIFLGIVPIILAVTNGFLLGFVSLLSIQTASILSLWRILPHGIFELPAIFISLGIGLRLGTFIFNKKPIEALKKDLKKALITFILIILPLLVIAALIEGILIGTSI